jgi:hypothetical protein
MSAAALAAPTVADADGADQTCQLTATRFDPDTVNVLYPAVRHFPIGPRFAQTYCPG